jgi:outer membrane protein OmpA-like peptidoglycan-associated protein
MSFHLTDSVKSVFPGEMINKMAGILGESSANVQLAMQGIIPSALTGIMLKAEYGDTHELFNILKEAAKIEIPFTHTSLNWWWNTNYKGIDYLRVLFGDKASGLKDAIAGYAGVSSRSASSLLSIVAPAACSVLGKHVLETNMTAGSLRSFLNSERKKVFNVLPAGIFLEGIMGFDNLSGISEKLLRNDRPVRRKKPAAKWILPVLFLLVAGGLAWVLLTKKQPSGAPLYSVVQKESGTEDSLQKTSVQENQFSIKLPGGEFLYVKKGSVEEQLFLFFNDPKSKPSRRFPFSFDQVDFKEGTATITDKSMVQIQNIALILKAFPKARIKIGGFNERGGDSAISKKRATSVASALRAAGVNPKQLAGVEGFGSGFAKYAVQDPDSLRDKDKRIAISVRAK